MILRHMSTFIGTTFLRSKRISHSEVIADVGSFMIILSPVHVRVHVHVYVHVGTCMWAAS